MSLTHFTLSLFYLFFVFTLLNNIISHIIPIQRLFPLLAEEKGWLVEWLETTGKSPVRSYLAGNAGSRLISEAKQPWACLVLGWGTTGEAHVLYSPLFFILFHWFSFPWGGPEPAARIEGRLLFFALCFFLDVFSLPALSLFSFCSVSLCIFVFANVLCSCFSILLVVVSFY